MKYILSILLLVNIAFATENIDRKLKLPKHIKTGLNEDMHIIQSHMNKILDSISRAQWSTITESSTELKNKFILKQKMKKEELEMLKKTLPKGYIESDRLFHYWAGVMAKGAKKRNGQVVSKAYSGLVNTCMTCHANYAPYMFKDFKNYTPPKENIKETYKHPDDWR